MICACGCEEEIPAQHLFRYKPPYLLRGHQLETPLCACGCGERTPQPPERRYDKGPSFIKGHRRRGTTLSPETRAAISATLKGRPSNRLGVKLSAETKAKISAAQMGRPGGPGRPSGFSHSTETKAKIRAKRATQANVSGIAPHGLSRTPTYKSWISMLWRCRDPRDISYPRYGGRGITVCKRWDNRRGGSFQNFLADMGERPAGMTLDRINGNGNYTPKNCRWATLKEQAANRPRDNGWKQRKATHA